MTDIASMLPAALAAAAPQADPKVWLEPLRLAFLKWGFNTPRSIAAALGQFSVEAGPGFTELAENLNYSPQGLRSTFPDEITSMTQAVQLSHHPQDIANTVYANRLGNGDRASGDGWRFRGRGLIQITGRGEYAKFAAAAGMSIDAAADYLETPEGAADSGCWYLSPYLTMAANWQLTALTQAVNGRAKLGLQERIDASNAALAAFGGAAPVEPPPPAALDEADALNQQQLNAIVGNQA